MDEGVIFQFLHPLQLAKLTEGLFKYLLCDSACQVPHKQHLDLVMDTQSVFVVERSRNTTKNHAPDEFWPSACYLGHDLWVWVLNGIGPLHSDHISPHLNLATHQSAAGLGCCFVVFILQEAKAPIFLFVIWLVVQYDII